MTEEIEDSEVLNLDDNDVVLIISIYSKEQLDDAEPLIHQKQLTETARKRFFQEVMEQDHDLEKFIARIDLTKKKWNLRGGFVLEDLVMLYGTKEDLWSAQEELRADYETRTCTYEEYVEYCAEILDKPENTEELRAQPLN